MTNTALVLYLLCSGFLYIKILARTVQSMTYIRGFIIELFVTSLARYEAVVLYNQTQVLCVAIGLVFYLVVLGKN